MHKPLHDLFVAYSGIFTLFLNGSLNIGPGMRASELRDMRGFLDRFGKFEAVVITLHKECVPVGEIHHDVPTGLVSCMGNKGR